MHDAMMRRPEYSNNIEVMNERPGLCHDVEVTITQMLVLIT